jgi:hypothetical protein
MHLQQQNSHKKNAAFFVLLWFCSAAAVKTARPLKRRIKGDEISSELIKKVKRYIHNSGLGASLSKRNK